MQINLVKRIVRKLWTEVSVLVFSKAHSRILNIWLAWYIFPWTKSCVGGGLYHLVAEDRKYTSRYSLVSSNSIQNLSGLAPFSFLLWVPSSILFCFPSVFNYIGLMAQRLHFSCLWDSYPVLWDLLLLRVLSKLVLPACTMLCYAVWHWPVCLLILWGSRRLDCPFPLCAVCPLPEAGLVRIWIKVTGNETPPTFPPLTTRWPFVQ